MKSSRLLFALGFAAALALAAREVRAQGDQSDIISAHGDALARSTSAPSLVEPMPTVPPNSPPPVIPSATAAVPAPATATPPVVRTQAVPAAPFPIPSAPQAQPAAITKTNPAAESENGGRRYVLIAVGALVALAMFLWERRPKD
jgi:hypothetical protein